jgi:peptide/nickel transport system substrate-binding protein
MRRVRARGWMALALAALAFASVTGCGRGAQESGTLTVLIESSPTSLDPRVGTDAQSERIDALIFDSLVKRDEHFVPQPWLATSWDNPDPLTYVFHLRAGVKFHDGQPLTSRDVKWTLDSTMNGTIISVKAASYATVASVDAPDPATVVLHLKKPDPELLLNVADSAFGVVPYGSSRDFWQHPVGSGPFRFVSQEQDRDVVIARNPNAWQPLPHIPRIRFAVVPDAITRALELRKGSADAEVNALTADMVYAMRDDRNLQIDSAPGTTVNYLAFNTRDAVLRDSRVREAIALAINRPLIIHALLRDQAKVAESLLPVGHWAWTGDIEHHLYDPVRANALLDAAGWKPDAAGVRFHLALKTSTDDSARLLAMVLQQELRAVGIALDVRSFEFATFYADITKGAFQMYALRWIGGNEDPAIFHYAYSTEAFPPHGSNRGFYANAELDRLLNDAGATSEEDRRRADYVKAQQILAREVPAVNLWYLDTVMVRSRRLGNVRLSASGNYDFLRDATLDEAH